MKKSAPNRQRGSIIVPVAVSLLVGLILLGGVQLGYYFHLKRELQNTADLAALSGVQLLSEGGDVCADDDGHPAKIAAIANIKENFKQNDAVNEDGGPRKLKWTVSCGTWDPAKEVKADAANNVAGKYVSPQYFEEELNSNNKFNALRVILSYDPPIFIPTFSSFFGKSPSATTISVEAIAKSNEPVAAFQIGSQLLNFNNKGLLGLLLGAVGVDISKLTVLDSKGLADATIKPSGLLGLLGGVGIDDLGLLTPDGVANLDNVTILQLIDASAELVGEGTAAAVALGAISKELVDIELGEIKLLDMEIPLGGGEGQPGLLAFLGIGGNDPLGGALDVKLGVGDLLKTAIAVAANGHALVIPDLDVLGVVKAKLSIVEPPVIAIGPVGTTGYSAQVRLWLNIDTDELLGGLGSLILNTVLHTRVRLPIALDLVSGEGELKKLECAKVPPTMDVSVVSRILNVCVGELTEDSVFSTAKACHNIPSFKDTPRPELIKLLGIPVLSGKLHIPAFTTPPDLIEDLAVNTAAFTEPNELPLGNTVEGIVYALLELLNGLLKEPSFADFPPGYWDGDEYKKDQLISNIAQKYLDSADRNIKKYDIDDLLMLIKEGKGEVGEEDYLPPLLEDDFITDIEISCGSGCKKEATFTEALDNSIRTPSSLLDGIFGITSCSGLSNITSDSYNECVKINFNSLLKKYSQNIAAINSDSNQMDSILDFDIEEGSTCNSILCGVLRPIVGLLKPILNVLGKGVLSPLLTSLGINVGQTEVKAIAIDCDPAQLVY